MEQRQLFADVEAMSQLWSRNTSDDETKHFKFLRKEVERARTFLAALSIFPWIFRMPHTKVNAMLINQTINQSLMILMEGMTSNEFSMKLLTEKYCAVSPGTAFDTNYSSIPNDGKVHSHRIHQLRILNSFVRVSLANSIENVSEGIHRCCDLLDEITV